MNSNFFDLYLLAMEQQKKIRAANKAFNVEVKTGIVTLADGDSAFNTEDLNLKCRSLTLAITELSAGYVEIADENNTATVERKGYTATWSIDNERDTKLSRLSIKAFGDAVVVVNYTYTE